MSSRKAMCLTLFTGSLVLVLPSILLASWLDISKSAKELRASAESKGEFQEELNRVVLAMADLRRNVLAQAAESIRSRGSAYKFVTVPSQTGKEAEVDEAMVRFQRGIDMFRKQDNRAALSEFRAAYAMKPSYDVLYNIGQAQYALRDFVGAQQSLVQYLSQAGADIPVERRTQVDEMLSKIREKTAQRQPWRAGQ